MGCISSKPKADKAVKGEDAKVAAAKTEAPAKTVSEPPSSVVSDGVAASATNGAAAPPTAAAVVPAEAKPPAEKTEVAAVQPVAEKTVEPAQPKAETAVAPEATQPKAVEAAPVKAVAAASTLPRVFVIIYSMYGHILKLAESVKEGLEKEGGVKVELYQVPETLPPAVLEKMGAPPKPDLPLVDIKVLDQADGFLFGFPTRFGMLPAQMKAFFDATGSLWQSGALVGKPAGFFFSTGTQGGGQETTALSALPFLAHQGMVFVPSGYTAGEGLFSNDAARGGSPYGAGTLAGADGSRQPSKIELTQALIQGQRFASITKKLAAKDAPAVKTT